MCSAGFYSVGGRNQCDKCSGENLSLPGSDSASDCKPCTQVGHGLNSDGECAPCEAGSYSVKSGSGCAKCPPGSFSSGGTDKCTVCKEIAPQTPLSLEGSTMATHCRRVCGDGGKGLDPENRDNCKTCPAGSYKVSTGNGCQKCKPGTYRGENDTACKSCPTDKPLSLEGSVSESQCKVVCPNAGQGLDLVTGVCVNCPAGRIKSSTGSGCQLCEAGSYSAGGSNTCTKCTGQRMLSLPGATSANDCKAPCRESGKGLDLNNANSCAWCPAGFRKHDSGYGCKPCDPGTYSTGGNNECLNCSPNRPLSLQGSIQSNDCKSVCADEGKGLDPENSNNCKVCPAGHYKSNTGNGCQPCEAGKFKEPEKLQCSQCPVETPLSLPGTVLRNDCRPVCNATGSGLDAANKMRCKVCPAGSRKSSVGDGCQLCEPGFYSSAGQDTCTPCPTNRPLSLEGNTDQSHCREVCQTEGTGLKLDNRNDCRFCPKGYHKTSTGNGCRMCEPGKYSVGAKNSCTDCPTGFPLSLAGAGSSNECQEKCDGEGEGLDPANRNNCKLCPAGYQKSESGNGCKKCEPGTFKAFNETVCSRCPSFRPLSLPGATSSDLCFKVCEGKGQGLDLTDATKCRTCPAGSKKSDKRDGCSPCEPGTYSSAGEDHCTLCDSNTPLSLAGSSSATDCKAVCDGDRHGLNAQNSNATCTECPAGFEKVLTGYGCSKCLAGQFFNATSKTCSACPSDRPLSLAGSAQESDCKSICGGNGQGLDPANASNCKICPAGHFKAHTGNGCQPCIDGTYKSTGQLECLACPIGTPLSLSGATGVEDCKRECNEIGKGLDPVNPDFCKVCPAGQFQANTGNGCQPCAAGFFKTAGDLHCKACPEKEPLSLPGSTSRAECRLVCEQEGLGLDPRNSSLCAVCPAGFKQANFGNGCQPCEAGTYKTAGELKCTSCPEGRPLSLPGTTEEASCQEVCKDPGQGLHPMNATQCQICPAGQDQTNSGNGCQLCRPGSYKVSGDLECKTCPEESPASDPGATNSTHCRKDLVCPKGKFSNFIDCLDNQCTCGFGTPAVGKSCTKNKAEQCVDCKTIDNAELNEVTKQCECIENFKKVNNKCEQKIKKFKSKIRSTVSAITFDPKMENKESPEFKQAQKTFCDQWEAKLGDKFAGCVVLKITQSVAAKRSTGANVEADVTTKAENPAEADSDFKKNKPEGQIVNEIGSASLVKECTCPLGNPMTEDDCPENGKEICASCTAPALLNNSTQKCECGAGFSKVNNTCTSNSCTCNFGEAATGAACTVSGENCIGCGNITDATFNATTSECQCNDGFEKNLQGTACVNSTAPATCTCELGTAVSGSTCTLSGEHCASCVDNATATNGVCACDSGFSKVNGTCKADPVCTCALGTPVSGANCTASEENCASCVSNATAVNGVCGCDSGFTAINNTCTVVSTPAAPATKKIYSVAIISTVSNLTWSSELSNKTSPEFTKAANDYCDAWELSESADYIGCIVNSFSQTTSSTRKRRQTGSGKVS